MLKKLLSAIVIATTLAGAAPISLETASQIAQNAVKSKKINLKHKSFGKSKLRAEGDALLYIFQKDENNGFVIVAGDDIFIPIIGISDKGIYDPNNLPTNFAWYIENIEQEMEFALENEQIQTQEIKEKWELYAAGAPYVSGSNLIQSTWDQTAPYWNKTPNYSGQQTLTGCVATAMSQIMNYHKYPASTTCEIPSYTTTTDNIFVNALPITNFNWNSMLNDYSGSYTSAAGDAVATLMVAAGISVQMDYTTQSSGAYSQSVPTALTTYFAYDYRAQYIERDNFTISNWQNIIKGQIDLSLPVYYSGQDTQYGGHAFVLDGYNNAGQFHFNWGWSGVANGFYVITALNPTGQPYKFNSGQGAVINIMPADYSLPANNLIQKAISGGTYKLTANIDGNNKITTELNVKQNFTLDLNGYILTIEVPDSYENGIKIAQGKTFTIMDSRSGGVLNVTNNENTYVNPLIGGAAINTTDGTLIIDGGTINAKGGAGCAGIGGAFGAAGGIVIINGGIVNAIAGSDEGGETGAAGIGGGGGAQVIYGYQVGDTVDYYGGDGGKVTITGGTITATGNNGGAGIGGGIGYDDKGNVFSHGSAGTFTLNGNAAVFANSVGDNNESRRTGGILFVGNAGKFYGTIVTPIANFTIPTSYTLTIPNGATLTITENIIVTNKGTITNNGTINGCINGVVIGNKPNGSNCNTAIKTNYNNDSRYGIRFANNIVVDKAEISIILPNEEKAIKTNIVIYDMAGNIVFVGVDYHRPTTWDLKNKNGRFVANGTYLVIAEVENANGNRYYYSAKLGVKR